MNLIFFLRQFLERTCSFLVRRLKVPPQIFGYRQIACVAPLQYCKRLHIKRKEYGDVTFDSYYGSRNIKKLLPSNIREHRELSKERKKFGIAFYDVPQRITEPDYQITIPNVKIVGYRDHYSNEFYSLITEEDRCLNLKGTGFMPEHGRLLRCRSEHIKIKKAAWFLEYWYDNYFHWLAFHLTKLVFLEETGTTKAIILPPYDKIKNSAIIRTSLKYMGIDPSTALNASTGVTEVEQLTVVNTDIFSDRLIRKVRKKFIAPNTPVGEKKFYISRENAHWRRIVNNDEIRPVLKYYDFEIDEAAKLSFEEQIRLMSDAKVIMGIHGAGLGNMLFCPQGVHVVEIADIENLPNPHYYAFARAIGHNYWVVKGKAIGKKRPAYRDIRVDPIKLSETLDAIG